MKIHLTKEQQAHHKSIKWLLQGGRRTGRTFLLAVCLIEKAIETGEMVCAFDHEDSKGDIAEQLCKAIDYFDDVKIKRIGMNRIEIMPDKR